MDEEMKGWRDMWRRRWGGTAKVRNTENERCPEGSRDGEVDLSREEREMEMGWGVGVGYLMSR